MPGGGRRLRQDLRVVEVEAAAERQPARGQHELAAAPLLGREAAARIAAGTSRGKCSGHTSGSRSCGRAALGRRAHALDRSGSSARQRRCSVSADVAVQVTCANARSTRSTARYVNGQARSKNSCAREGSRAARLALRALPCAVRDR